MAPYYTLRPRPREVLAMSWAHMSAAETNSPWRSPKHCELGPTFALPWKDCGVWRFLAQWVGVRQLRAQGTALDLDFCGSSPVRCVLI